MCRLTLIKPKKSTAVLALSMLLVMMATFGNAAEEQKKEHIEREHEQKKEEHPSSSFKLDERTKEILLKEKTKTHVVMEKALEYFLNNPNREFERQCFQKFKSDESVDFVIDLAPSPSEDKVDKSVAESPISLFLQVVGVHTEKRTPSRIYFRAISTFIEAVTFDMKPENTHSIIYDQGNKYYIRGKSMQSQQIEHQEVSDFSDSLRNLKTMWPSPTKQVSQESSFLQSVLKNNLGRMTKLALWNRNNGLPSVLADSRHSKPIYTVVITDGSSGSKISDLVDDLSRTTVIDIGNRRFVQSLDWNDMRGLLNVVSLTTPQQLAAIVDSCRLMACRACGC